MNINEYKWTAPLLLNITKPNTIDILNEPDETSDTRLSMCREMCNLNRGGG